MIWLGASRISVGLTAVSQISPQLASPMATCVDGHHNVVTVRGIRQCFCNQNQMECALKDRNTIHGKFKHTLVLWMCLSWSHKHHSVQDFVKTDHHLVCFFQMWRVLSFQFCGMCIELPTVHFPDLHMVQEPLEFGLVLVHSTNSSLLLSGVFCVGIKQFLCFCEGWGFNCAVVFHFQLWLICSFNLMHHESHLCTILQHHFDWQLQIRHPNGANMAHQTFRLHCVFCLEPLVKHPFCFLWHITWEKCAFIDLISIGKEWVLNLVVCVMTIWFMPESHLRSRLKAQSDSRRQMQKAKQNDVTWA